MLPAQQSAAVPEVPTSPQAACAPSAATAESENLNPTAEDAAVLSELVNSMALDAAGADRMEQAAAGYVRADTCSLVRIGSVNLKGHGLRYDTQCCMWWATNCAVQAPLPVSLTVRTTAAVGEHTSQLYTVYASSTASSTVRLH